MSDLDAVLVGIVLGLAIVGAVLLRNEEKVREAWRQRRGGGEPKAGPGGRWILVGLGLLAMANVGIAAISRDPLRIPIAAGWLLVFGLSLRRYRRSQGST